MARTLDAEGGQLKSAAPGSTRDALLDILKRRGESDVTGLAEKLGISGVAVRQHLASMERDGHVAHRLVRRPVGRPVRFYSLTPAAEQYFPQRSDRVALDLLARVEKLMGRKAIQKLFDTRLKDLDRRYREQLKGARSWRQKLERLAAIRDSEGYLCSVESTSAADVRGGIRLVEHHCPLGPIAKQHPQICDSELALFRSVLREPDIKRTGHIRNGGHACVYEVSKQKPRKAGKAR